MPPQQPDELQPCALFEHEAESENKAINTDNHDHLEDRKVSISVSAILKDLRNLDWSKVVWRNAILFALLHVYSVYGLWLALTSTSLKTIAFSYVLYCSSGMGITMGAHRLWAHRSYKANLPLRIILAFCQTMAFQNDIFEWSRDHRVHHKYSETDADPHNAKRGFFFSHMGWLMYRKHPKVIEKGKKLDLRDLEADPVVRFQRKYYVPLMVLVCFVMPTVVPWICWKEDFVTALMVAGFLRYTLVLHITWLVNSLAHWVGSKPFEKYIQPSQNSLVAWFAFGEGWHNYHHVFPWDYRAAELGGLMNYNLTSVVINFCEKIGWAWDLKTVSDDMIKRRALRTGDGSYKKNT